MIPERINLKIENLSVQRQGRKVLEGIDLTMRCGEAILLSGANGCGKTTLLRSIAGLQPKSGGSIELFGSDAAGREWRRERHLLAYVPQEETLSPFPVSVEEMAAMGMASIGLSRKERRKRVTQALKDTGCLDLSHRSYFALSGGEKRRVSLARCLCQRAHMLLLDEPLTYLDKKARQRFISVLARIREQYDITILMVTHSEDDLDGIAWKRYRFEKGAVVAAEGENR